MKNLGVLQKSIAVSVLAMTKQSSKEQIANVSKLVEMHDLDTKYSVQRLAYMLATIWHETANTFMPIEEYGKGKGKDYGKIDPETGKNYYGRGFVQITWGYNYKKFNALLGIDLYKDPDQALNPEFAAQIAYYGMHNGMFTGKKLCDYIYDGKCDYVNARRIINGLDQAEKIAKQAALYESVINDEIKESQEVTPEVPVANRLEQWVKIDPKQPEPMLEIAMKQETKADKNPWWQEALNSKIFWTNLIGLIFSLGIFNIGLPDEAIAKLAEMIVLVMPVVTMLLRTFFNKQSGTNSR